MLNLRTVTTRALRWTIIAEVADIDSNVSSHAFAKANSYIDVLDIPWSGKGDSRDNLQKFGRMFAECYVLDRDCNGDKRGIGEYMDDCLNSEKYKA